MSFEKDFISGYKELMIERDRVIEEVEFMVLDYIRNVVAEYSREYCYCMDEELLMNAASNVIMSEIERIRG